MLSYMHLPFVYVCTLTLEKHNFIQLCTYCDNKAHADYELKTEAIS